MRCLGSRRTQVQALEASTGRGPLADDKERLCERVRLGVEKAGDERAEPLIRALLECWLERVWKSKPSYGKAHSAIHRHLMNAPFAARTPKELSAGEIEEYFEEKTQAPGPKGSRSGRRRSTT
jgi:hypothetical protein